MPTSNELIEELVSLTRDSLRNVEKDISELRADVRVLTERLTNQSTTSTRIEGDLGALKGDATRIKDDVKGDLDEYKKGFDDAVQKVADDAKDALDAYKKDKDAEVKRLEERLQKLEQAHAKYLGAAAVAGAVLGFVASLAKGFLGL